MNGLARGDHTSDSLGQYYNKEDRLAAFGVSARHKQWDRDAQLEYCQLGQRMETLHTFVDNECVRIGLYTMRCCSYIYVNYLRGTDTIRWAKGQATEYSESVGDA